MSNNNKPENLHADQQQNDELFRKITEMITGLSTHNFLQLRTWLIVHHSIEMWKKLMKS